MLAPLVLAALLASPVCHGQDVPPTPEEKRQAELESYAETRASFGFRSDIPYIRELIRRGRWESDVGYIPVTRAEDRYLRLRDRLDLGGRAYRYLRARRDLSGGISIEDDWPREPYLLVRLTRDRKRHQVALRRLARFPDNLRTVQVARSVRQLSRLANRIGRDDDELDAAGFYLSSWGPDLDSNTVEVDLITTRTDHAEYFARRYGPVTTNVIATERTQVECANATRFEIADGGNTLILHWGSSGQAKPAGVELREYPDRVEVGVLERLPSGGYTLDLRSYTSRVALSAPLGDRAVIDALDTKRLRQRGPSPGEPPCPRVREPSTLDQWIADRRRAGLRHDRAFARRMLRRPPGFTDAEQVYLGERDDLLAQSRTYLRRHRDESGGVELRGRFPEPVLVARFTRRIAFHRRNLERLVGGRVRVLRSPYTVSDLRRTENRVERRVGEFVGGWGDDGVMIRGGRVEGGRVVVQVVSAREDYAAVVRERFGPSARVVRVGRRHECVDDPFFL